jgi:hypothetical protein
MARQRTARCAHCGDEFAVANRSGPDPTYCSRAHRQAAYEARRRATRPGDEQACEQELTRMRSRVSWLEHDNAELRRERDEAIAELTRLQLETNPPSPVLQRLLAPPGQHPYPVEPPPARRRWKLSR